MPPLRTLATGWAVCALALAPAALADDDPHDVDDSPPEPARPAEERQPKPSWTRVDGILQARITTDADLSGKAAPTTTAAVQRIILGARGGLFDDALQGRIQLWTRPQDIEITDVWMQWTSKTGVQIRVGQQKVPFTAYRDASLTTYLTSEWAYLPRVFGSERQIGVRVDGGYHPGTTDAWLDWSVGVFEGSTRRTAHGWRLADVYGAPRVNLSTLRRFERPPAPHPELVAKIGFRTQGMDVRRSTDRARDQGARGAVDISLALDSAPDPMWGDFGGRLAVEGLLKVSGLSARSIAYLGAVEVLDGSWQLGAAGSLNEVSYRPVPAFDVVARYGWLHITDRTLDDAVARAGEGEAALTPWLLETRHEVALGVNGFAFDDHLKLSLDATWFHDVLRDTTPEPGSLLVMGQTQVFF